MTAIDHPRIVVLSASPAVHRAINKVLRWEQARVESGFIPLDLMQLLLSREFDIAIVDPALPAYDPRLAGYAQIIQPWLQWIVLGMPAEGGMNLPPGLAVNPSLGLEKTWQPDQLRQRVAEALDRKKKIMQTLAGLPLNRILFFLEKFQVFLNTMLITTESTAILNYLYTSIIPLIPCDAAAVFDLTPELMKLTRKIYQPVTPLFLQAVENEAFSAAEILSGKPLLRDTVRVETEGRVSARGITGAAGSLLVIPFFSNHHLLGLLAFAAAAPGVYASAETAYLCLLANSFARIFPNLSQIQSRAIRDELTGLYNRHYFNNELERTWQMSQRYTYPIGLLMMDLDAFKSLNDTCGHLMGDAVLREFARLLESVARRTDVLARYGGDEFAVILPNADLPQARAFAERLREVVARHVFCEDRNPLQIGVSIGVTSNSLPGIANAADFVALADRALYLSKEEGKGKISTAEQVSRPETVRQNAGGAAGPAPRPAAARAGRIMIIDDEASICELFAKIIGQKGYTVLTETNPRRALARIRARPREIDVALIDLKMPEMDGLEVLAAVRKIAPAIVPILITGFASVDNAVAALRAGAYDFIKKPVQFDELVFTIQRGVEHRRLIQQLEGYRRQLEDSLEERSQALRETSAALEKYYMATLEALSEALKMHEADTVEHNHRVADFAVLLAHRLRLGNDQIIKIRRGALLHDLGKIGIPDAILQKPGPLSEAERKIIHNHPAVGYQIIKNLPFLKEEAEMLYQHHERYDGTGYPRGLAGKAICLGARVFAVVDTFDAIQSDRVYRKAVSRAEAVAEIQRGAGTQFDPEIVNVFLTCWREMERLHPA